MCENFLALKGQQRRVLVVLGLDLEECFRPCGA
jgi:hypothetical protein